MTPCPRLAGRPPAAPALFGTPPGGACPDRDAAKLVVESDLPMYHAKESGTDRIAVYTGAGAMARF